MAPLTQALAFLEELDKAPLQSSSFSYMTGGRRISRNPEEQQEQLPDEAELKAAFLEALAWFENEALGRHAEGPYLLGGEFSLLDIMCISYMERVGAGETAGRAIGMEVGWWWWRCKGMLGLAQYYYVHLVYGEGGGR